MVALIVIAVIVVFALVVAARGIRVIPQARAGGGGRLGPFMRTPEPGLTIVTPFIDRVRPLVDLREQVVNFNPQPEITEDNVVVGIYTMLYFTITDPRSVLDEATGKSGIRINRVEIKSVDPPPNIKTAMEKQMRAERDRRALILTAEGEKTSQILTAEGAKQSAVLTAEGERQAAILRAEGEAKAIDTVFKAIHEGKPTRDLLSYEYLKMLPQPAEGDANK